MREQSASQTLYEGIMEALGYRANRQPFLKLAHRAPWTALAREALAGPESESECSGIIERRLLELSGLSQSKERAGRRRMGYGLPLAAAEWHCFRVRPANHPRHRIAGAARLLARFLYFESLETEVEEGQLIRGLGQVVDRGSAAKLTSALTVAADPGQPTAGLAYVGGARAKDLAVNVVLPFFHALAEAENTGSSPALKLYHGFGKLQDNELTREMAALLLEPGTEPGGAKIVTTARRQQGLIHLHRQTGRRVRERRVVSPLQPDKEASITEFRVSGKSVPSRGYSSSSSSRSNRFLRSCNVSPSYNQYLVAVGLLLLDGFSTWANLNGQRVRLTFVCYAPYFISDFALYFRVVRPLQTRANRDIECMENLNFQPSWEA